MVPAVVRRRAFSEYVSTTSAFGGCFRGAGEWRVSGARASLGWGPCVLHGTRHRLRALSAADCVALGGVRRRRNLFLVVDLGLADSRDRDRCGRLLPSAASASVSGIWGRSAYYGVDAAAHRASVPRSRGGAPASRLFRARSDLLRCRGIGELVGRVRIGADDRRVCDRFHRQKLSESGFPGCSDRHGRVLLGDAVDPAVDHRSCAGECQIGRRQFQHCLSFAAAVVAGDARRTWAPENSDTPAGVPPPVRDFLLISDGPADIDLRVVEYCHRPAADALSPRNGDGHLDAARVRGLRNFQEAASLGRRSRYRAAAPCSGAAGPSLQTLRAQVFASGDRYHQMHGMENGSVVESALEWRARDGPRVDFLLADRVLRCAAAWRRVRPGRREL